jgi:MATE family multidrug resistance protein
VSNLIGQGRQEEVWALLKKVIRVSFGLMTIVLILINLLPRLVLSVYGQDSEFVDQAIPVLRIVSLAMLMHSCSFVFLFAVTGSGNSRVTLMIEAVAIVLYSVYVYLVLDKYFLDITYGWMSEWLYSICMFLPSFLYMRSNRWKNKVL